MIGKITKGKSFHSLINDILDEKKDAKLIDSGNVITMSNLHIINSFNIQAKLNPKLKVMVGHISLDFHKNDLFQLSDAKMVEIAQEYLAKMGVIDTQYIIGRHFDKEHPHIHIAFNRVDNQGETITDKNDFKRNEKTCKELTLKFGLYYAEGKENVKTHRLQEPDKTKYQIYESIQNALPKSKSWNDFVSILQEKDIDVGFKYKRGTDEIQGITFSKNGYSFSGSKIDQKFSYSKLNKVINENEKAILFSNENLETPNKIPFLPIHTGRLSSKKEEEDENDLSIRNKKGLKR